MLEDAIGAGDVRVVLWFLSERHAGRDPVRRVAEAVVRQAERAGTAPRRARAAAGSSPERSPPRPVLAAPRGLRPTRPRPVAGEEAARAAATRPAVSPALLARVARRAGYATAVGRCLAPVATPILVAPRPDRGPYRPRPRRIRSWPIGGPVEPATRQREASVAPAGLSPRWPKVA